MKQRKENYRGVEFTLLKVGKKWLFAIPAGIFRTPFISQPFPTKKEATHRAIELIASILGMTHDPDNLGKD